MNLKIITIFLILLSILYSCKGPTNYKDASIVRMDNKYFIKVKGRRGLLPENISDIFKTYEDSDSIPLPYLKHGVYKGSEIRFVYETYVYTYNGSISISPQRAIVNLSSYDSVSKQIEPYSWNGDYHLTNY